MNILGLHFGHDASIAILVDGAVAAYVLCERHRRIKHAISLRMSELDLALRAAGVSLDQIDCCAISSTQGVELIIDDPHRLSIRIRPHPDNPVRSPFYDYLHSRNLDPEKLAGGEVRQSLYDPRHADSIQYKTYRHFLPEHVGRKPEDFTAFGWIDHYLEHSSWTPAGLDEISRRDLSWLPQMDDVRLGRHCPVTVTIDGRSLPGFYVCHQSAHAASSFYFSGFDRAAILTHDGFSTGLGTLSGMFFIGEGNRIYPLTPHHLFAGAQYDMVSYWLNLGDVGPAGKLMGLAAYGQPRFFDRAYTGNWFDVTGRNLPPFTQHCFQQARMMNYDMTALADPSRMTAPVNIDIAASTQKLFEDTYLWAVESLYRLLQRNGRQCEALCLSGGTALNCPSNTRVWRESPFAKVFVEPGCDDSGIALGAAMFVYHNLLDGPRRAPATHEADSPHASPYLGIEVSEQDVRAAIDCFAPSIIVETGDAAVQAAQDLASDRIVGWIEGRSEIGPRALGHRSILADPRKLENWARVNQLKHREAWRPLAPAVLASHAKAWFRSCPNPSPYMLFNAAVGSQQTPAITHVDGSARVQTVGPECGQFFRLVEEFARLTAVPMVLNTSFNGPGEPLVERPEDALRFLINSTLDVLYLNGIRIRRRPSACQL